MNKVLDLNSAGARQREPGRAPSAAVAFAVAAVAVAASTGIASAQSTEVCVECAEPAKTYVCQIEKAEKVASFRAGLQALQYLCVSELARIGSHARCTARRNADNCLGTIHTVSIAEAKRAVSGAVAPPAAAAAPQGPNTPPVSGQPSPLVSGQPAAAAHPPSAGSPQPAATPVDKSQPPRTMKELAERTLDASGQQAKDAGDAVSKGVSKTWKCIVTLFQKC